MTAPAPVWVEEEPEDGTVAWRPNPPAPGTDINPQSRALKSTADELLYGGAKGGAKSETLLVKPLYEVHKSAFAYAFIRQTHTDLQRPLDRAHQIYGALPTRMRPVWAGDKHRFTFPSGAFIQFGYTKGLSARNMGWLQGGNWAGVSWDEIGNEPNEQLVDAVVSEIRCPDTSIMRQLLGSANPGFAGHPWIKRRIVTPCGKRGQRIHFIDTKLPNGNIVARSRQFIPAKVTDNPVYANDDVYMAALLNLPERLRKCLLEGDWDASSGAALDEMDEQRHIRQPFQVPAHWPYMAGFDWGFGHNAVFLWARVSEDGRVFVIDTIKRRWLHDWDLAGVIEELAPVGARTNVQAGTDVKSEQEAKQTVKSTQERFLERKIALVPVSPGRVFSYRNLLSYLSWRGSEYVPEREPMLQFFDTPGNRWLFTQLGDMVLDPDDPRDVLKVDASDETGEGGDDGYDALRYMLAQRPVVAKSGYDQIGLSAFDPAVMAAEAQRAVKREPRPHKRRGNRNYF